MAKAPGIVARVVDALVATVAPRAALERAESRETMMRRQATREARLRYEAAKRDRVSSSPRVGSADHHLHGDLRTLRDASRRLVRDDAHAAAAVRVKVDNVVGDGINVQAAVQARDAGISESAAREFNDAAERNWREWCAEHCDASGRSSFHDLTRLIYQTRLVDGEAFVHETSLQRDGGPTMAIELIDADRVDETYVDGKRELRNGVELDGNGRAVGYWVRPYHPDDIPYTPNVGDNEPDRLKAKTGRDSFGVVHVFDRQRPGQTRGVPMLVPALPLFEHLHHYLDSEIIAARVNANFAMYVRRPVDPASDPSIWSEVTDEGNGGGQVERYHEFTQPGTIEYLNPGEEIQSFAHNRPGTTFDPFVARILRAIAAACNLPYEMILKDFGGMNYSSARVALLEARRGFDCERNQLVSGWIRPTYETVTLDAMHRGKLPQLAEAGRDARPFLRARYIAAPYGLVDPTKEVAAARDAIAAGLSTRDHEAARAGLDAGEILEATARDARKALDLEQANDLPPGTLLQSAAGTAEPPTNEDPTE